MTRGVLFLFSFFVLMTPVFAGDPGNDFWSLVQIRKANWTLSDQAAAASKSLREGDLKAADAQALWEKLLKQALDLKMRSLPLETGEQPEAAKAVTQMMRLQILRLEGLIKAARVESTSGLAAARPLWVKQVGAYQNYHQQEALVLDMMNWIEEHP